jgi:protein-S-isoprenylcysteine O-methyltransferase Ste14
VRHLPLNKGMGTARIMDSAKFDIRNLFFTYRSYTPIPFLIAMLLFAHPTGVSLLSGFTLVLLGEGLRFWGVSIVGSETRTTGSVGGTYLVTTGPFAYVRNPLYVGNMLLYAGVGVMSMALFPWLLLTAVAWFYLQYSMIVSQEEEYLAAHFGGAYDEYRKHVPRFLPRITPYVSAAPSVKNLSATEGLASERRTLQAIGVVTALLVALFLLRG